MAALGGPVEGKDNVQDGVVRRAPPLLKTAATYLILPDGCLMDNTIPPPAKHIPRAVQTPDIRLDRRMVPDSDTYGIVNSNATPTRTQP